MPDAYKKIFQLFLTLIAFSTLQIASCNTTSANKSTLSDLEISIFFSVLKDGLLSDRNKILLVDETSGNELIRKSNSVKADFFGELQIDEDLVADWQEKNLTTKKIAYNSELRKSFDVIDKKKLKQIFSRDKPEDTWKLFRRTFLNFDGFVTMSTPGVDESMTTGLVMVEFHCGPECGTGKVIKLTKQPDLDEWEVEKSITAWIAF